MEAFTFLFTDIEGSTALLQRVRESAYGQVLASHHAVIRAALAGHGGREIDTAGDGFFAVFSSPRACVAAALEMQQALTSRIWPGNETVRVRMGVHCGEAEQTAAGFVGLDVHRAARIAAVAHGGQVLVSDTTAALVGDALPLAAVLRDLGVHRLKDLGRPLQLFQLCGPGLQTEFPPLRSLGSPALPNNLPTELTTFIGRERELAKIRALMDGSRLVTLTGPGGGGKTRLGLQVAAELVDGSGDGVWLVELAAVSDDGAVAAAIAQALRIPLQPGRSDLEVVADALAPQDILIVLDNCEHVIGGCAKTTETLLRRCPKVHVIATSRELLGIGGETIYRVPSLSLPEADDLDPATVASCDAVALFAARAQAQGVSLALDADTVPVVVSMCRKLDGLPLAIELAAARLRSMSLTDLASRLDQRFRLLTGGSRTVAERQQTLRTAVDWSYSLLTRTEQVLLARLAVFAGGFDLAAAEQVCGFGAIDALDVFALLGSLVDKSLVAVESAGPTVRYRMLETIRLFAAERLAEAGSDEIAALSALHCTHYLAVAEEAAPHLHSADQGRWRARLDADQANLRRATTHAAAQADGTAQMLRFGIALWRYWAVRYAGEEAAGLLVPVLRRPQAALDPQLFAEALVSAARAIVTADLATGVQLAGHAEIAEVLGDSRLLILARGTLCLAYFASGKIEIARRLGQESVERARQLGDDLLLGMSLRSYLLSLEPAEAWPLYAEAIACTERCGDLGTNGALHNNAGIAAMEIGDLPGARAHLEAAIQRADATGFASPTALGNLGLVLRGEHDLDSARSAFDKALRISRRTGDKRTVAFIIHGLACLATDLSDWHRAAELHGAAQELLQKTGHQWEASDARYRQGSLDQAEAALGTEQFRRAYALGAALSFDEAIDVAFERTTVA
ncbi:MAG: adenylate/guanylate cyclase domain-containing protein [Streptosporangiaceae bacterium]